MKKLMIACLLATASTFLAANSASAQIFGQPGYGDLHGGLPTRDTFGGYRPWTVRPTPRYRTNTGSNWTNRGYTATPRTTRTTVPYRAPIVRNRWEVYTTAFTSGDATSVVNALKRSGHYSYYRSRTIPYRPYSRTVYDVMILR